ncbi:hypothetical protein R3I93_006674 [Phoxinus phoxinus]|uniref:Uncharacterized protein n=1 Tax=Phoxinus phoxinus TaxID=58324 RepID=A0AAN9D796_9TELE
MVKLFNIAYFIAKEEAAFTMFPKLTIPGPRLHQFMDEVGAGSTWQGVQISRTNADDDNLKNLKLRLTNSFCEFAFQKSGDRRSEGNLHTL